jgi:hypothetical protein
MSSEPRNVLTVIVDMYKVIPATETEFRNELNNFLRDDLVYCAPETLTRSSVWFKFEIIMKRYIQHDFPEWKKNCIEIYTGQKL